MKLNYRCWPAFFIVLLSWSFFTLKAQTGKAGFETAGTAADTINRPVLSASPLYDGKDDEVTIPLGSRTRRLLPGVISVLKSENLPQVPFSNLNDALTGLLPGVYISKVNTAPGYDASNILIRGRSSYNDAQPPLILVDGVERDFADMDVSEIESVNVLKDAASLAWYGIRGSNGVILVTTRHGTNL